MTPYPLWPTIPYGGNGQLGEPIGFDYTAGHGEPIHAAIATALNATIQGGVRNLESQGRQLFARHLYCLMLLLVDENYIAPWDENDPQLMSWIGLERSKLTTDNPTLNVAEADMIVKRKLDLQNDCAMGGKRCRRAGFGRNHDAIRVR